MQKIWGLLSPAKSMSYLHDQRESRGQSMVLLWLDGSLVKNEELIVVLKESITNEIVSTADASLAVMYHEPQGSHPVSGPMYLCRGASLLSMSMPWRPGITCDRQKALWQSTTWIPASTVQNPNLQRNKGHVSQGSKESQASVCAGCCGIWLLQGGNPGCNAKERSSLRRTHRRFSSHTRICPREVG